VSKTNIIHIQKNDDFREVFDALKNTEAQEIIFIFPNNSNFAKKEQNFSSIKTEADSTNKKISIMTSDPSVVKFASTYGFSVLEQHVTKKRETTKTMETRPAEEYSEPDVRLAAAKTSAPAKILRDIIRPESDRPIKIKTEKSSDFKIEVKTDIEESDNDIAKIWASQKDEPPKIKNIFNNRAKFTSLKSPFKTRRGPIIFFTLVVLVLLLILYTTLGSARVVIKPQKETLDFKMNISASSTATEVSLDFNRIPGQKFAYKDKESSTFPATGQKNVVQKASGKITIYNKGTSPQRLVATTRFQTNSGLIYRIPQTIEVPAAKRTGDNTMEGSIESIVYADKAGDEYNIAPSNFTIPGFEGSPKSNDFYAKSTQPMTGGIVGPSKIVTEEDFIKAQEDLTNKLKEKIIKGIKNQAGDLKIIDSIQLIIDPPSTNVKSGEAAENLNMTINGSGVTIAFRESDVLRLIRHKIEGDGTLELSERNLTIIYSEPKNNQDNSAMNVDAHITGGAVLNIDSENIKKEIQGMNEESIRSYFQNIKEIESTKVILSPFWVSSIPKDLSKIKIIIEKE